MEKKITMEDAKKHLLKWQKILRLQDWQLKIIEVNKEWRKTGDIKIDMTDRKAIVMINTYNPKQTNLESLIIHELLHLKLWGMDQLIEGFIKMIFGEDEQDLKYQFAFTKFMEILEPTVEDLAKSFTELGGEDKSPSFGRVQEQVNRELE